MFVFNLILILMIIYLVFFIWVDMFYYYYYDLLYHLGYLLDSYDCDLFLHMFFNNFILDMLILSYDFMYFTIFNNMVDVFYISILVDDVLLIICGVGYIVPFSIFIYIYIFIYVYIICIYYRKFVIVFLYV